MLFVPDCYGIAAIAIIVACVDIVCYMAWCWSRRCPVADVASVWRVSVRQGRWRVTDLNVLVPVHRCDNVYAVHMSLYVKVASYN